MITVYFKNADNNIIRHVMDDACYYCEWRKAWIAYDQNVEPDEDGCAKFYGIGDTRDEAINDLILQWEERQ